MTVENIHQVENRSVVVGPLVYSLSLCVCFFLFTLFLQVARLPHLHPMCHLTQYLKPRVFPNLQEASLG